MPHYRVRFRNYSNQMVTVQIYDMTETIPVFPTFTELVPAENPLVIQEDSDTDRLKPIRKQSGHLQLLQSSDAILDLTSSMRWRVKVSKPGWNWFGWICADNSEQDFHLNSDVIVYNIVDDLGVMQFCNVNRDYEFDGTFSLLNYLKQAIANVDDTGVFPFVTTRSLNYSRGVASLQGVTNRLSGLDIEVSLQMWESVTYEEDGTMRVDTATNFKMLEDWMRILGCTLRSDGLNWYIETVDDVNLDGMTPDLGTLSMSWSSMLAADTSADISTVGPLYYSNTSALSLEGAGQHSTQVIAGNNTLKVTAGGNGFDSSLIQLQADQLEPVGFSDILAYNSSGTQFPWKAVYYKDSEFVTFNRYLLSVTYDEYSPYTGTVGPSNANGNILWCPGAVFLTQDYYETGEENDEGSGSSEDKRNYTFTQMLYILQRECKKNESPYEFEEKSSPFRIALGNTEQQAKEWGRTTAWNRFNIQHPLLTMRSSAFYAVSDGGLCISFKIHANSHPPYGPSGDKQVGPVQYPVKQLYPHFSQYKLCLICTLRIGGKYYVTTNIQNLTHQWQTTPGLLVVRAEPLSAGQQGWCQFANTEDTKRLSQLYTCTGFSIPISGFMSGEVEFQIIGVSPEFEPSEEDCGAAYGIDTVYDSQSMPPEIIGWDVTVPSPPAVAMIKDLNIMYCPALSSTLQELPESNTIQTIVGGFGDAYEIDTPLCSSEGKRIGKGTLYAGNALVSRLWYFGESLSLQQTPERHLLSLATRTAGRTQNFFSLCVRREYPRSLECITYGGHTWRQVAVSDFDVCSGIMTVLYVRI